MRYMYAALLLHSASRPVNEDNMRAILAAAGIKPDENRIKVLVDTLSSIKISEILEAARTTLAPAAVPGAVPAASKEEKKTENEQKGEALEGLGALFG